MPRPKADGQNEETGDVDFPRSRGTAPVCRRILTYKAEAAAAVSTTSQSRNENWIFLTRMASLPTLAIVVLTQYKGTLGGELFPPSLMNGRSSGRCRRRRITFGISSVTT